MKKENMPRRRGQRQDATLNGRRPFVQLSGSLTLGENGSNGGKISVSKRGYDDISVTPCGSRVIAGALRHNAWWRLA